MDNSSSSEEVFDYALDDSAIPLPSKTQIEGAMTQLNIDLTTPIEYLTDAELRRVFRLLWPANPKDFCNYYRINRGNFSSYLKERRLSKASADAIRCYLSGRREIHPEIDNPIYSGDSLLPLVTSQTKIVIFVDGDNWPGLTNHLDLTVEHYQSILVLYYLKKGTSNRYARYRYPFPIYIIESKGKGCQAVDIKVSMDAMKFHCESNPSLIFGFASRDNFLKEVTKNLSGLGRSAVIFNTNYQNLGSAVKLLMSDFSFTPESPSSPYSFLLEVRRLMKETGLSQADAVVELILFYRKDKSLIKSVAEYYANKDDSLILIVIFTCFKHKLTDVCNQYDLDINRFSKVVARKIPPNQNELDAIIHYLIQ